VAQGSIIDTPDGDWYGVFFQDRGAVGTFANSSSAVFSYRTDESQPWTNIGTTVNPTFSLQHFTGVRFGLFNYATKEAGGYVDFDYFHVE